MRLFDLTMLLPCPLSWKLVLLSAALAGCSRSSPPEAPPPPPVRVAAAADLASAFEELGRAFERTTGQKVTFSFASTGVLAKQLAEGAPFDLFAAANVAFVDQVVKAGACDGATQALYARGHIVLWTREGGVAPAASLEELADERFKRIAIANPEHAPYGMAAKQALQAAGLWERVQPRLVYGENVRQALQLAETGNVEAAFVSLSLVKGRQGGQWLQVEERLHAPLDQALVTCRRGASPAGGKAFADFIASAEGRGILRRYGFLLPGEPVSSAQ
jgi:molybdate transport system substrate-binding protein